MKRKASFELLVRQEKARKDEFDVYSKALSDLLGEVPLKTESLDTLCRAKDLQSICRTFRLEVKKSGGRKQPASVKRDYIDAILLHLEVLKVRMLAPVTFDTSGILSSGRPSVNAESEVIMDNSRQAYHAVDERITRTIRVRLYSTRAAYHTHFQEEVNYQYDHHQGVSIAELSGHFQTNQHPEKILHVLNPQSYTPIYAPEGVIDSCLVPVLMGNSGYLRVCFHGQ